MAASKDRIRPIGGDIVFSPRDRHMGRGAALAKQYDAF
jgi:hypothetical protein